MIVRPKLSWFKMLFVWHGSVLRQVLPPMILVLATSLGALLLHRFYPFMLRLDPVPFSLLGIALAIFLGFRNAASYDRFWEGRKLWGGLLNDSRTLTRQALTLTSMNANDPRARGFVMLLIAFAYSLKHQLRDSDDRSDLNRLLPPEWADEVSKAAYRPMAVMRLLATEARAWREQGLISDILAQSLDSQFNALTDIVGGCERLSNTLIPFAYDVLLHRTVTFYCILLPFGLVGSIGLVTPAITVFIAYAFMAWNAIASELEEPFGIAQNDLALDSMSRNIERSLLEMLGDSDLPPPVASRGGYWLT